MKSRKIKKGLCILAVLIVNLFPLSAYASKSSIRIDLPEGMEGASVEYGLVDGEKKTAKVDEKNEFFITGLKDGSYFIRIPETERYQFQEIKVDVPMIHEDTKQKAYEIIIQPKYKEKVLAVEQIQTGDSAKIGVYTGIGLFSLIIVAIMSCHNRFKCDRMSDKYSRKRRI